MREAREREGVTRANGTFEYQGIPEGVEQQGIGPGWEGTGTRGKVTIMDREGRWGMPYRVVSEADTT